ncbi:hypothetical protein EDD37DRAFT_341215 [Exophiala viscosa]|uniref:Uncharacterized protein n=1 Tax=Exophiala viscosa TaxID=2486360 RepID=A0AAN6DYJ1_9EURO|nr:hypothetical protein EDD36DRAFT_259957 [Exophiala viscosa]KAI1626341.1 hypothetical protein EDD37DRAFT_341215 [Exophiala viscosa]
MTNWLQAAQTPLTATSKPFLTSTVFDTWKSPSILSLWKDLLSNRLASVKQEVPLPRKTSRICSHKQIDVSKRRIRSTSNRRARRSQMISLSHQSSFHSFPSIRASPARSRTPETPRTLRLLHILLSHIITSLSPQILTSCIQELIEHDLHDSLTSRNCRNRSSTYPRFRSTWLVARHATHADKTPSIKCLCSFSRNKATALVCEH